MNIGCRGNGIEEQDYRIDWGVRCITLWEICFRGGASWKRLLNSSWPPRAESSRQVACHRALRVLERIEGPTTGPSLDGGLWFALENSDASQECRYAPGTRVVCVYVYIYGIAIWDGKVFYVYQKGDRKLAWIPKKLTRNYNVNMWRDRIHKIGLINL